jgi:hypothetical protein
MTQTDSHPEQTEVAMRLGPDGVEEIIPLTREILLNPSLDVQVPQNPFHDDKLSLLRERLGAFLRQRGLRIHSDVIIDWPNVRNVSPDLSVFENLLAPKPGKPPLSIDVAARGCRVCAVFEVVSSGKLGRWKDEQKNPPFFARQKVDDCVLLYPLELRRSAELPIRVFSNPTPSGYTEQVANAEGFFLLPSIGVLIGVERKSDDSEEIVLLDAKTGERIPDVEEAMEQAAQETKARRRAERQKRKEVKARLKAEQEKLQAEQEKLQAEQVKLQAEQEKLQAEQEKLQAEQEKEQEAEARRQGEQENRQMAAEIERLRAQLGQE